MCYHFWSSDTDIMRAYSWLWDQKEWDGKEERAFTIKFVC